MSPTWVRGPRTRPRSSASTSRGSRWAGPCTGAAGCAAMPERDAAPHLRGCPRPVRYANLPTVFCDTRSLAEEWTFRYLGAALAYVEAEHHTTSRTNNESLSRAAGRPSRRDRSNAQALDNDGHHTQAQ